MDRRVKSERWLRAADWTTIRSLQGVLPRGRWWVEILGVVIVKSIGLHMDMFVLSPILILSISCCDAEPKPCGEQLCFLLLSAFM